STCRMSAELPQPSRSFLRDVDARLTDDVQLHCCGGFVVTTRYGFARKTADLDVLLVVPTAEQRNLAGLAGRGSELRRRTAQPGRWNRGVAQRQKKPPTC